LSETEKPKCLKSHRHQKSNLDTQLLHPRLIICTQCKGVIKPPFSPLSAKYTKAKILVPRRSTRVKVLSVRLVGTSSFANCQRALTTLRATAGHTTPYQPAGPQTSSPLFTSRPQNVVCKSYPKHRPKRRPKMRIISHDYLD
jgi:hypothetical protein